ncbi:VOC family protein [Cytobacillus spongiae]|uniref:VOC family protein n=1 Tax=Cytobacillus spongiae TaxID=2901381 RepID=UPI001F37862F|nr:VOC family protein [Cytobacillus spongiae]UII57881.1 VOC family protein [Cytobacillus spongiae]
MGFHQPPITFVGEVILHVENLTRAITFYKEIIGLQLIEHSENDASFTADGITKLLSLKKLDHVVPKLGKTTGLYHFALLLPNRGDLAIVVRHLIKHEIPFGSSDHLVSEAIYLNDPEGNGIEIYCDRKPSEWSWKAGQVEMAVDPLDFESLLSSVGSLPWTGLPPQTVMGHIHLHVSHLKDAENFYVNGLGFEVVNRYGSQALFIANGQYHHHIGLNTWNGVGAPKPPEQSTGLQAFTVNFGGDEMRESAINRLKQIGVVVKEENGAFVAEDPAGNRLYLKS